MISDNKAKEIVHFCYKVLYLLADPPVNFDKILKQNDKGKIKTDWFYDHVLSFDKQKDIIKRVAKIYGLRPYERDQLKNQIQLGCSPTDKEK